MKKKGLIVATIVMVLVLAVSLTTATYAWFTASSVTSIEGFGITITSNNDVNIGFLASYTNIMTGTASTATKTATNYITGDCTFTKGADGSLGGTWATGTSGLSATLNHDILWGAQTKAVALNINASNTTEDPEDVYTALSTDENDYVSIGTGLATSPANKQINAANKEGNALTNVTAAKANYNIKAGSSDAEKNGDYVHMVLGVQPNKAIDVNHLCIAIDWSLQTGANLGALTAIHIAYRTAINGAAASAWQDIDLFRDNFNYDDPITGEGAPTTNIVNGTAGSQPQYAAAYIATYGEVPERSYMAAPITGLSTTAGYIDQVELIIYLDGTDPDCNNYAINNISGALKIFFCTSNGTAVGG